MKKFLTFLFVATVVLFKAQLLPGKQTLDINGRSVDVVAPANFNTSTKFPVVFFLHGLGGDKNSFQVPGVAELVTASQIIAVFPEGSPSPTGGRAWNSFTATNIVLNGVDDVAHLTAVRDRILADAGAAADASKVFSIGFSNGASMNLKMVKNTNVFKSVVIGAMTEESGANGSIPATASKVPMLWMHGMADQVVPYNGGTGVGGVLVSFEPVVDAVNRWAVHNTGQTAFQKIYFQGDANISEHHYREFRDEAAKAAPIYQYLIPNAPHDITAQRGYDFARIFQTSMNFFKNPLCYGLSRQVCIEKGKWIQ